MSHSPFKIYKCLYPVSWIYGAGVWLRNKLFDWGYYKSRSFDLPVICIGNITVGGTGKTPHTEYLIRLLQKSYQVAVLSRGYKRKSKGFVLAQPDTPVHEIGDEPYQMKQKFPNIHMAVDKDRCHGIEQLCRKNISPATDVILLDDAFQHRHVQAGLNILLVDFNRLICEDALLPAGRMREHESGKDRANIVIITKCPKNTSPMDYRVLTNKMNLYPYQDLFFSTFRYGKLHPLFNGGQDFPLQQIRPNIHILLVTGIASPKSIQEELGTVSKHVHPLPFSDHHDFSAQDMGTIKEHFEQLPEGERMIITTEKDAVRMANNPHLATSVKPFVYVLPIEVTILQEEQESFNSKIMDYVRKNSRNSHIPAK